MILNFKVFVYFQETPIVIAAPASTEQKHASGKHFV